MGFRLNHQIMAYAMRFGLTVGFAKGLLSFLQQRQGLGLLLDMCLYFLIAAVIAIPLYFYKQERKRCGKIMDHIVMLCMGVIVTGGILHDQISVRVSPEYYHIGHFPIPGIQDATLLAVVWGILGTWWFGAGLGMVLATIACTGERAPYPLSKLIRISLFPLIAIEIASWLMGAIGFWLTRQNLISIGGYSNLVTKAHHPAFMADWWANGTAYTLLLIGCIFLSRYIWRYRQTNAREA
jgi:hypothetical protein